MFEGKKDMQASVVMNAPNGQISHCVFTQIPGDPALMESAEQVLIDILRSDAPLSAAVRVRLCELIDRRTAVADARSEEVRRLAEINASQASRIRDLEPELELAIKERKLVCDALTVKDLRIAELERKLAKRAKARSRK